MAALMRDCRTCGASHRHDVCPACAERSQARAMQLSKELGAKKSERYSRLVELRKELNTDHRWQPPRTVEYAWYWSANAP